MSFVETLAKMFIGEHKIANKKTSQRFSTLKDLVVLYGSYYKGIDLLNFNELYLINE
jgi:hypothetical protein